MCSLHTHVWRWQKYTLVAHPCGAQPSVKKHRQRGGSCPGLGLCSMLMCMCGWRSACTALYVYTSCFTHHKAFNEMLVLRPVLETLTEPQLAPSSSVPFLSLLRALESFSNCTSPWIDPDPCIAAGVKGEPLDKNFDWIRRRAGNLMFIIS